MKKETTQNEFSKEQKKAGEKLFNEFQSTLEKLGSLGYQIGNNEYIVRAGINMKADIKSETLANSNTKMTVKLTIVAPPKSVRK